MKTPFPSASLPDSQAAALALLRAIDRAGWVWHFDDSPADLTRDSGAPLFTPEQCAFASALVDRLNDLFRPVLAFLPPHERNCVNAGAWVAAELAGWCPMLSQDGAEVRAEVLSAYLSAQCQAKGLDPLSAEQVSTLGQDSADRAGMLADLRDRCGLDVPPVAVAPSQTV